MNWEINILQTLQEIRTPFLTTFMEAITAMAESLFLVVIIAILYWCVNKKKSIRIAWIVLLSSVVNGMVKNIVRMPRPFQKGVVSPLRVETATSYSFPSGHTQTATSFWGSAASILNNKTTLVLGITMIGLTALSRLYLGVHWPMDVIGGIILGVVCVGIGNKLLDDSKGMTPKHLMIISSLTLIIMLIPVDADLSKAVAALWGLVLGLYIEQRYIHFKEVQEGKIQMYKILIGISGMMGIYLGMSQFLPNSRFIDMIKYALIMLWITSGAPYLFKEWFKSKE